MSDSGHEEFFDTSNLLVDDSAIWRTHSQSEVEWVVLDFGKRMKATQILIWHAGILNQNTVFIFRFSVVQMRQG